MSLKRVDGFVGITVDLNDVEPIHPGAEEAMDLPRSVRVTRVLRVQHPVALMEVEDTTTGKPFAMRFRFIAADVVRRKDQQEEFCASVQHWADSEEAIARQASCGTPAHLVAVQKGLGVPLYAGRIANLPEAYLREGFYCFSRVQIFEGLHGQFDFSRLITSGISVHAKEYIASRLLQIVFKLQQAQLSHNDLSWDNIYARPDGSFVLSGFDDCTPLGKPIGIHIAVSGKNLEPTLRIQDAQYTRGAMASANSDLWSLGMLLYELFTDGKLPYTEDERSYTDDKVSLAFSKYLIDQQVDPKELVPILDASNCPPRWKMLIVRLLQPLRCERITAWDILREFPDLVGHSLPR
ncbi:hypothetical protein, conserved [Eimeria brunetti]|uniref:Protein kinase domain-containing protein n=1 Tax=Eimeria brunetti TaxID=51314 RepID=U6LLN9_9EIME|nr:hypothetical protein, conserved [Eimeria brunetti]